MSAIACEPARVKRASRTESSLAPELLSRILAPYQPTGTDYLKEASVAPGADHGSALDGADRRATPIATAHGRYTILNSCYIQSTGHFNAVEFLICYNQLAYATFGHLVAHRLLDALPDGRVSAACQEQIRRMSIDLFFAKQLSSMFILRAGTRFKRVIDTDDFAAELSVDSIMYRHGTLFIDTTCRFSDDQGGDADGNVLLAYPVNAS
jgi:FcoT-like thioesterase domain